MRLNVFTENRLAAPDLSTPSLSPEERAKKLLLRYLSDNQRWTYLDLGFFYVQAKDGKIFALGDGVYAARINPRTGHPVELRGCYPSGLVPVPDRLLGQMLLLKANPRYFYQVACRASPTNTLGYHAQANAHLLRTFLPETKRVPWYRRLSLAIMIKVTIMISVATASFVVGHLITTIIR